jgi:ribonuclease R
VCSSDLSPDNRGHFGLSLSDYTHFTSPIRRYPDLMIHRALLADIAGDSHYDERQDNNNSDLRGQGEHLSQRERTAMNAEREIVDRLKFQYMRHHLHERFSAIISGVTDICLYIEIPKLCVSGAIPIERLQDDYYIFDSKHHRLFGEITAKTYQLGDTLKVQLNDVDIYKRRLNFDIVS